MRKTKIEIIDDIAYPKSGYSYLSSRNDMSVSNITRITSNSTSNRNSKKRRLQTTNQYIGELPIFSSPWNEESIIPDIIKSDEKTNKQLNENESKKSSKNDKKALKDEKSSSNRDYEDFKDYKDSKESKDSKDSKEYGNKYDNYSDDKRSYKSSK